MQLALTTCEREPSYVLDTLNSLETADPAAWKAIEPSLRLVVDGVDSQFLGRFGSYAETAPSHADRRRRIFSATTRALAGADPHRPMVLCQDDVEFAPGWWERLGELVETAERRHGSGFVIALWHGYPWHAEDGLQEYMPRKFYGNVCLYLSAPVLADLAPHMSSLEADPPTNDDLAVRAFLHHRPWFQLLAATPCLAQHIGDVSTDAACSEIRRSPTFGEPCLAPVVVD